MGKGSVMAWLMAMAVASMVCGSYGQCTKQYPGKTYASCQSLSLGTELAWTYMAASGSVEVAFKGKPAATGGWIGWGINPTAAGMVGTQALIASVNSTGAHADTYSLKSKVSPPSPGALSFKVPSLNASSESDGSIVIFASIHLPSGGKASVNHVWNVGPGMTGLMPQQHAVSPANLNSAGTINLATGTASTTSDPRQTLKNRHGIINVVGWGVLMPIGAMIARYMRMFDSVDPAWFYMHAFCQTSGYILGVSGWGVGLKLGSDSVGVEYTSHRRLGISMFALGTLQVFALLLRPKKDHKLRIYWNVYHHSVGYSVIILSIINIFKGYDILKPESKYKNAYIGVIISIGAVAVILEVVTWAIWLKRRRSSSSSKPGHSATDGNGHEFRHSHV